jgi:NTP pyrophosphatase (non-canonical NTP hydrolase)
MELKELLEFIDLENKRLIERFGKNSSTQQERILARTVKLTEELGELCNEVLAFNGDQRQEKLDKHDKNNLPNEFADVIITTLILAKAMNIDIEKALEKKIKKVNKRYE